MAITNAQCEKFKCGKYATGKNAGLVKEQDILWDKGDGAVKGLGMRLSSATGVRTFVLRYRVKNGKEIVQTIGRMSDGWRLNHESPDWDARQKARDLIRLMRQGVNPVEQLAERLRVEKAAEAKALASATTLRECMEAYLTVSGNAESTKKSYRSGFNRNWPEWMDQPAKDLTRDKILKKYRSIVDRGSPGEATLQMDYLRAVLNHARRAHEDEEGNPTILASNPVARMWELSKGLKHQGQERDTRIPLPRIGACWNALLAMGTAATVEKQRTTADLIRFMLLTGTRRGEASKIEWRDCDFENRKVTFRKENIKTGRRTNRDFVLPMSTVLHDLLKARQERRGASDYVFASIGKKVPVVQNAAKQFAELSAIAGDHVHFHALRRTHEDIATEAGVDPYTREMMLNHSSKGNVHGAHYANNRAFLVAAVQKVADWISREAAVADEPKVVSLFPSKTA
ncbi:hypothetical protein ACG33_06075 [Steroidobacter denitrificans]|uniref:Tyr recombinase domain-containing protein n=1 Tax=Steroidobacter denitrificans TaxID=465721 RepID=A0A127FAN7_STEDE|nr:tyrosine-type recombinase/integrase [Steroidobacter denitrificans]AMN46668.1 hypothetical protein ACG33_06075 [Steroidobacter denitrificans]